MATRSRKALIIGAGIAGPVAAILLRKAGFEAQVFEAWPYSTGIGGGLQIAPNGMHVLAAAGLADKMIRRGSGCGAFGVYSQTRNPPGCIKRKNEQRVRPHAGETRRGTP